ncbi:MAG: hypothetical protein ACI4ES_15335 [Roseburia sp.]
MKDLIEERDRKAKIQKSVIKSWNVHYMTPEELKELEKQNEAADVYARLEAEAAADEAKFQAEIEAARRMSEDYNKTTGAYSGQYGKQEVDSVTQGQIDKILGEKDAAIRSMIDEETKLEEQMAILGEQGEKIEEVPENIQEESIEMEETGEVTEE